MRITINKFSAGLILFLISIPALQQPTYAGNGLNIIVSPTPLPPEGGGTFVGSKKCAPCHEAIYKDWLNTPHARAWKTLQSKQAEQNPACLRCHSTGYTNSGSNTAPQLVNVQCESCHGPASEHMAQKPDWSWIKANCPTCQIRKVCMRCHTPKHSPNFNLDSYLEKIQHP